MEKKERFHQYKWLVTDRVGGISFHVTQNAIDKPRSIYRPSPYYRLCSPYRVFNICNLKINNPFILPSSLCKKKSKFFNTTLIIINIYDDGRL